MHVAGEGNDGHQKTFSSSRLGKKISKHVKKINPLPQHVYQTCKLKWRLMHVTLIDNKYPYQRIFSKYIINYNKKSGTT